MSYYSSYEGDYTLHALAKEFNLSLAQDNTQLRLKGQFTYDEVGKDENKLSGGIGFRKT